MCPLNAQLLKLMNKMSVCQINTKDLSSFATISMTSVSEINLQNLIEKCYFYVAFISLTTVTPGHEMLLLQLNFPTLISKTHVYLKLQSICCPRHLELIQSKICALPCPFVSRSVLHRLPSIEDFPYYHRTNHVSSH